MPNKTSFEWRRGERAHLARIAGIEPSHLSAILHRKRGVSQLRARKLELCAASIGKIIPWEDWISNRTTAHGAFFGVPEPLNIK